MKRNGRPNSESGGKGHLIVISAPSGAGKSTIIQKLLKRNPDIVFSISYTTRGLRAKERDGVDYHFIQKEKFEKMIDAGKFLEWAKVHDNYYGTAKDDTKILLNSGKDVILDIDVQGARQVSKGPFECVKIFLLPPSREALIKRLTKRGDLSEQQMTLRLKGALKELKCAMEYDYLVMNDDIKNTVKSIESIILSEKKKLVYNKNLLKQVLDSFRNGE